MAQSKNIRPLEMQVGGHKGVQQSGEGDLIMKPCLPAERDFYQAIAADERLAALRPHVAKFYGTLRLEGQVNAEGAPGGELGADQLRELGTVLYDDSASEEKKLRMEKAAKDTTSFETGVRLTGFSVYDPSSFTYTVTPKEYGKSIKAEQLPEGIARFFPETVPREHLLRVLGLVHDKLVEIQQALAETEIRMVAGSVLIVWEGDPKALERAIQTLDEGRDVLEESDDDVDDEAEVNENDRKPGPVYLIKLIDFAHTRLVPGQGPDESLMIGMGTTIKLLEGRIRELRRSGSTQDLSTANVIVGASSGTSDIVSISVFGQTIVVLNSAKSANELLEQRVDWGKITGLLPYGERWRAQRRMTHLSLHKGASREFWPLVVKQARFALRRIADNPDRFIREIRRMSGSTLLSAVYGYEVTSADDPLVEIVETALDHLCEAAIPGNFLVNVMPWIRYIPDWVPGSGWKKTVDKWRKEREEMVDVPFNYTKQQIASEQAQGIAPHSVLKGLLTKLESELEAGDEYAEQEDRIKWVTATLFGAGSDTSAATTSVFILAMVLNQSVFARAQAEVDAVIGRERLPEMSDRGSLAYVECVMKEVLRWQPVVPLAAIPHAVVEDDEYRGWAIPKGSTIIGNIWAISYDETIYHEPEQFNPDRFLDPETQAPPAFGSCPGVHLAESTLFVMISTLLALFDIRPAKDEDGSDIIPEVNMKANALVSYPADFRCSITPRSEKAIGLLNASILEA
ncbi:cytochrome P450, partial [Rhizoctonia solani]